jgi:hypothetical protein
MARMDEKPDREQQLVVALYQGLVTLAVGGIGSVAFWLSGNQKMVPITLLIAGVGLLTLAIGGFQLVRLRRRKRPSD